MSRYQSAFEPAGLTRLAEIAADKPGRTFRSEVRDGQAVSAN